MHIIYLSLYTMQNAWILAMLLFFFLLKAGKQVMSKFRYSSSTNIEYYQRDYCSIVST